MTTTSTKPIIVIVHGAFHPPIYYRKLIEPLRAQGYTVLAPPMPTTGLDDSVNGTTYVDDVRRIHESLLPLFDKEGREAVVVGHSQGGIAAAAVTEGQTVAERKARGLQGGIRAMVYIAAGAHYVPVMPAERKGVVPLYNSLPTEAEQWRAAEDLVPQSRASVNAAVHFVAADVHRDVAGRSTYVVCTRDMAVPVAAQRAWAAASGCRDVVDLESDHSPFLGDERARRVVHVIVGVAESSGR
ncbi:hypothetical protein SLS62_004169 [Diatrype stigma]|uniref:AB hydrolase-1 domain-containing protein n=1 Tax=Diatrype stigma TaxID=117547 RepID=A0AAN9UR62_9PEZI